MENIEKKSNKKTRILVELIIILICVIFFIVALLSDYGIVVPPDMWIMKMTSTEDLLLSLFSVQASIASIGIAIVSIINGVTSESYLGISFSEYVTSIKPIVLKHKRLLITSLVLIVVNYVAASFMLTNFCVAILVVSVVISVRLVADVYAIFRGSINLRADIRDYVISNYDAQRITDIKNELINAIEVDSTLTIDYTCSVLKDIFEIEVTKHNEDNETIDIIEKAIAEAFAKIVKQHNSFRTNQMMKFVYDIYCIANRQKSYVQPLNLWPQIYRDFYGGLADITDEQIREDYYYFLMHDELYKNIMAQAEDHPDYSFLKYYSCWTYNELLSAKTNRTKEIQKRIKKDLYELTTSQLLYNKQSLSLDEQNLRIQELCYLLKVSIDSKDTELIEDHFFDCFEYRNRDEMLNLGLVVILIYLYYLAARETLKSGKEVQDFARELLRRNRESLSYFYYELDILLIAEKYKILIDGLLRNWEQMDEGVAKHVVIIDTIDDFFLFSICAQSWNRDKLSRMLKVIAPEEMFPIYQRYFAKESRERISVLFDDFCKLFAEGEYVTGSCSERLEILEDIFNERYHQEIIQKGSESSLSETDKNAYAERLCDSCAEFVKKNLSQFRIKVADDRLAVQHDNDYVVLYMQLPNSMIREQRIYSALVNHVESGIMEAFLNCIFKKLEFKEVESSDRAKQKCLIDMINALAITPTIAIGHRDTFWGEEDERLLQKFTEGMEHIKYPGGYNSYFIIDGQKIEFSIQNIRVEYSDVPAETILRKCEQRGDGKYYYNITNDIYIPFEKHEIVQYVQNTQKVIKLLVDISYRIPDTRIGAGIQIIPRKSSN